MDYATGKVSLFPRRAVVTDDAEAVLRFAIDSLSVGRVAIATLVEIRGGAARSLGSQMAIAADGGFTGYVSGGCIEAAVACEAVSAIEANADRMCSFGAGSPFFDIALPCGGGITVFITVLNDSVVLSDTLARLKGRQPASIRFGGRGQVPIECLSTSAPFTKEGEAFVVRYQPRTRLIVSGGSLETAMLQSLAIASNYDVVLISNRASPDDLAALIDSHTAVIFLHHDLDAEEKLLDIALISRAFYVGALGSSRTNRIRYERLSARGHSDEDIRRLRAPIGLFGPTRDAGSLAISVLAEVASVLVLRRTESSASVIQSTDWAAAAKDAVARR